MNTSHISSLRVDYGRRALDAADVLPDPIDQFKVWFEEALNGGVREPNAMTLATADKNGKPSARIVLLKDVNDEGFTFYTNYTGRKGVELNENPVAALLFWWIEHERQVRIEGRVAKVSREESEAYFQSRPRESRIGAWASPQSRPVSDRAELETRVAEISRQYDETGSLLCPPFWGGYRVIPETIEFWQGRPNRLHDRIVYKRSETGEWHIERLAP